MEINKILDNYKNIYITADLHFGHKNILNFEDKRWDLIGVDRVERAIKYIHDNQLQSPKTKIDWDMIYRSINKECIKIHDQNLIRRYNDIVTEKDLVFILGDISFYGIEKTNECIKQLAGDKILVRGNHDYKFDKELFISVTDYLEINYKDQGICMMHYPISYFKNQNIENNHWIHLHGHLHSAPFLVPKYSYNVGLDVNKYRPIKLEEAIKKALSNKEDNNINGEF